jgi:L-threonylcarbamoyladenylate synthase
MPRIVAVDRQTPDGVLEVVATEAAELLRRGGLVAFPTETVYGVGARAVDEKAVGRVFSAKGRPRHHPLIAHVAGESDARRLAAAWPTTAERLAAAFWPGPLTLVVERSPSVSATLSGGGDSIAVRAPAHAVARALVLALGDAIAAPSANRYQGVSPTTAAHVVKELGDAIDLVIDGGPCDAGIESTVVDVRSDRPRVLRLGALPVAALRAVSPEIAIGASEARGEVARASPGMDPRHYAPRASVVLAPRGEAMSLARGLAAQGARVGLVIRSAASGVRSSPSDVEGGVLVRVLPESAPDYARGLYATLHELDDSRVDSIVIERVPEDEAWLAVADRLARASEA